LGDEPGGVLHDLIALVARERVVRVALIGTDLVVSRWEENPVGRPRYHRSDRKVADHAVPVHGGGEIGCDTPLK